MASSTPVLLGDLHSELGDGGVVLAVDADEAGAWMGDADDRFEDFNEIGAAAAAKKREQPLGGGRCLLLGCGVDTQVFRIGEGLGWVEFHPHDAMTAKTRKALAEAMASMKAKGKPKTFGRLEIQSGCVALVMAHAPGKVPAAARGAVLKSPKKLKNYKGGTLVALARGTYVASYDKFERETDDGFYVGRLRLEREA